MKLSKDKIEELKKAHGSIYLATIEYKNEEKEQVSIEFVHKKPTFEDYETYQKDVVSLGSAIANQNLIVSMKVHSEDDLISKLSECPIAVDTWMMNNVLPHFGGDIVKATSTKL